MKRDDYYHGMMRRASRVQRTHPAKANRYAPISVRGDLAWRSAKWGTYRKEETIARHMDRAADYSGDAP